MKKVEVAALTVGAVLLIALAVVLRIGYVVLICFMFYWNITDIQNVGVNFWNVFWLALASIMSLGFIASFFRKSS